MKVLVCVIFVCTFHLGMCNHDGFEYPEDWVDPGDMFTFDTVTKRNIKQENSVAYKGNNEEVSPTETGNLPEVQNKIPCPKCSECPVTENNNDIFLRRYTGYLLQRLQTVGKPPDYTAFDVYLRLSEKSWKLLNRFVDGSDVAIQDVINILEESVKAVHPGSTDEQSDYMWKFEDYFHMPLWDVMMIGILIFLAVATLSLEMLSKVPWLSQLKRLVVLAFLITFPITYYQEYQIAVAENRSSALKVPEYCKGINKELSFWEGISMSIRHFASAEKDPCQTYHENYLIDPFFKVPPTKVLAVVFSKFFLEPLSHFGTAFSKTFKNVFSELPGHLWIPAFLFLMVLMVFLLLLISVCFGYAWNLNLPFWSGIEIGPPRHLQAPRQMEQLMADHRQQLQVLQSVIERQNAQPVQALPTPTQPVSPGTGLIGSFLGRLGLGGQSPNQQSRTSSAASNENIVPPYPTTPEVTRQRSAGDCAMPDLPPEASTLRRRGNCAPYPAEPPEYFSSDFRGPVNNADQQRPAAEESMAARSTNAGQISCGQPPPVSPPSYTDVEKNPSLTTELPAQRPIGFEGVSDEPVFSQPNPQDVQASAELLLDHKHCEVEKNDEDTDDSDIEILSRDSIEAACMDGNQT